MFEVIKRVNRRTIKFSATLENIDVTCACIREFLNELGLNSYAYKTLITSREALCNAVIHGCNSDPGKKIRLNIEYNGSSLIIGIEDQGDGFDWESKTNSIPAPDAESGRGLAIIKHHTGEIQHNKKGNKMTLKIFT